jgi:hypothetical protein
MSFCEDLLSSDNASLHCLYFAAVLVLLLLIIMQLWKVGYFMSEGFQANERAARNVAQPSYKSFGTSGADVRFSQMHSASNVSSTDGSATGTSRDPYGNALEPLVNTRGEPDFWEIGAELGAYKRSLAGQPGGPVAPAGVAGGAVGAGGAVVSNKAGGASAQGQARAAEASGVEYYQDSWMGGNFAGPVDNFYGAPSRLGESFGAPSRLGENFVDLESKLHGFSN